MVAILKVIIILIKSVFSQKSLRHLSFVKEQNGRWYIDLDNWPDKFHDNLEMVFGANKLLDTFNQPSVSVCVSTKKQVLPNIHLDGNPEYDITLTRVKWRLLNGAFYEVTFRNGQKFNTLVWLCPVTLFVFGRYPKNFYVLK